MPTTQLDTTSQLADRARNLIRDFPAFFEQVHSPLPASTVRLARPLIGTLEVTSVETGATVPESDYSIDTRNGVVKFNDPQPLRSGVSFMGYHYEWFLPEDLEYFAEMAVYAHMHGRTDISDFTDFSYEEKHATAVAAVVGALASLLTEFAMDIDVSTPEGMMIPAHMRFGQLQQMYEFWAAEYRKLADMLNIGLERIEIFDLRRVSRLTNRFVPQYREREIDDPRPPIRVFPEIPAKKAAPEEGGSEGAGGYNPEYGISQGGWTTIGTSGG
jgi:hypothetical protein